MLLSTLKRYGDSYAVPMTGATAPRIKSTPSVGSYTFLNQTLVLSKVVLLIFMCSYLSREVSLARRSR